MINTTNAYFFLTGLYIGGYSNFFSKLVITGLVIHMSNQSIFSYERFRPLYTKSYELIQPYISKIYKTNIITEQISPRLNILKSDKMKI